MSNDAAHPDPSNGRIAHDEQLGDAASANGEAPAKDNWKQVEDEYQRVIEALNRDRVSFTVRSAEGITLYGGLDTHSANGNMRRLANIGHFKLLERVKTAENGKGTKSPGNGELDGSDTPSHPAQASDQ